MARRKDVQPSEASLFSFGDDARVPGQDDQVAAPGAPGASADEDESRPVGRLFGAGKSKGGDAGELGPQYGYRRHRIRRGDEVSVYTQQMDERYAMDPRKRALVSMTVLVIVLIPLLVAAPTSWLTPDGISRGLAGWVDQLQSNLQGIGNWLSGVNDGNGISVVFWQTLAVALVGGALALNGAVYQGALKNALASPSTLGVMSGGTLGTVIYTLAFIAPEDGEILEHGASVVSAGQIATALGAMTPLEYLWATQGRALCSIIGCFAIVALVLLIAYIAGRGTVSKSALVIAGQVFASVIAGVVAVVRTYLTRYGTEEQIQAIQTIVGGSVQNIMGPFEFCLIAIPLAIGFAIIMRLRFRLNLLAFNDEEARSMGISVAGTRNAVMIVCTLMTAVVVSFCGNVGFVGFLVPHVTRKIVGPDLRYLIPASVLVGAVYLLLANYLMSLGTFLSSSLGTFTSLLGVVFFIVAVIRQRRRGNADWI